MMDFWTALAGGGVLVDGRACPPTREDIQLDI